MMRPDFTSNLSGWILKKEWEFGRFFFEGISTEMDYFQNDHQNPLMDTLVNRLEGFFVCS